MTTTKKVVTKKVAASIARKPSTPASNRLRFSASLIQQGNKQFYSVTMPTEILAAHCFVTSRHEDVENGFQRVLDKKRAEDIARYIDSGEGTIPGSIILSAQEDADLKVLQGKTIEFSAVPRAFLVLDGQHRVYGFRLASTAFRVPVVIYSGLTPVEEARLFIDINTKQRQVPNELLLDIKQLAQREDQRDTLLRQTFDLFSSDSTSVMYGLMSASSRQHNRISRVTFNLAMKPALAVFNAPNPLTVFSITNAYLAAFKDVLEKAKIDASLTAPTTFRAVFDIFPEVARISAAQHGKNFSKQKFAAIINPIGDLITRSRYEKASASVKSLGELFSSLIKKDFSI
ncbi:DGQHR domain-containing protein [Ralstonia wenshanensis]|uniref:DGQHR domain-containing protein n=1 Tax=Ralstonia wenshanensis TaxID=2842456 RepID=UPI002AAEAC76|nr:DGQHR domain-containing protein [Ralstonia wenshanensis]MDY7507961.1 DGQHR domain-containing protein [Ralstonia wenshanensis]